MHYALCMATFYHQSRTKTILTILNARVIPPVLSFHSVHARAAVAVAAVSGDEASIASESVTVLSASPSPAQGVGSHLVLKVPASIDPRAVQASLLASEGVEAVVQNRVVRTAQVHGAASECSLLTCIGDTLAVLYVLLGDVARCS